MSRYAYLWFIAGASLLIGCGGGNGGNDQSTGQSPESGQKVVMQPDETYRVYRGDRLVKQSPDARVRIGHTRGTNETTVTLLQGQALIIRR